MSAYTFNGEDTESMKAVNPTELQLRYIHLSQVMQIPTGNGVPPPLYAGVSAVKLSGAAVGGVSLI